MNRALFALTLAALLPLGAQVRYEDILAAPNENWLTFMGDYSANRHSPLKQITAANVGNLVAKWVYHVPEATSLSAYPIVYNGVMYELKRSPRPGRGVGTLDLGLHPSRGQDAAQEPRRRHPRRTRLLRHQ